ncbi:MAG: hypothetical protein CVU65_14535 [Deltaproteobacteria bacterium HGW-Deltaproteobacteria-22]|jgi:nicotinamidase-related amidase|nr:cysteine hydrolase [Myxococcota bacterium]PKN22991.1 MAG: hypothetical protein CVU65_14535 [Deltaproteobacteria bacterium HGW-Deltaproteobacteria-22]
MRAENYLTPENREEKTRAWLDEIHARTPPRDHWRLDPAVAALLVIDVQRVFCDPSGSHALPAFAACVGPLAELIGVWRAAGRPIVFSRHGHGESTQRSVHGRFYRGVLDARDPEAALVPPACPETGDLVFDKDTYDAFFGTCLADWLRQRHCSQILVAGVLTHLCVESTVRSGFVQGFEPFVVLDGCATSSERMHLGSLVAMASGFSGMLTAEQAVQLCR